MRKYYFTIASILVLAIGMTSCSNEENKIQSQVMSRPTIPVLDTEVRIGNQIWMTKNLNVSRYRNGDPIPQVQDFTQWINLTTGAWCYYQNNTANGVVYGKLYNWYAVNDPRGLAPAGWHIPNNNEWVTLIDFLGGPTLAGSKMKGTSLWRTSNTSVNSNSSGFTGLPGGNRDHLGPFYNQFEYAYWWSSSEYAADIAWNCALYFDYPNAYTGFYYKKDGLSVRCIKD